MREFRKKAWRHIFLTPNTTPAESVVFGVVAIKVAERDWIFAGVAFAALIAMNVARILKEG